MENARPAEAKRLSSKPRGAYSGLTPRVVDNKTARCYPNVKSDVNVYQEKH